MIINVRLPIETTHGAGVNARHFDRGRQSSSRTRLDTIFSSLVLFSVVIFLAPKFKFEFQKGYHFETNSYKTLWVSHPTCCCQNVLNMKAVKSILRRPEIVVIYVQEFFSVFPRYVRPRIFQCIFYLFLRVCFACLIHNDHGGPSWSTRLLISATRFITALGLSYIDV